MKFRFYLAFLVGLLNIGANCFEYNKNNDASLTNNRVNKYIYNWSDSRSRQITLCFGYKSQPRISSNKFLKAPHILTQMDEIFLDSFRPKEGGAKRYLTSKNVDKLNSLYNTGGSKLVNPERSCSKMI